MLIKIFEGICAQVPKMSNLSTLEMSVFPVKSSKVSKMSKMLIDFRKRIQILEIEWQSRFWIHSKI